MLARAEMQKMMRDHLNLTTEEVVARLQSNWPADIAAFDKVREQILHMADMLTDGIVKQHSSKFKVIGCILSRVTKKRSRVWQVLQVSVDILSTR